MPVTTRRNNETPTDPVEDPEVILRRCNMTNVQENADVVNEENNWDGKVYTGEIPSLYVPDMDSTRLRDAVEKGMALNTNRTEYLILCPKLKRHIGTDRLRVEIPSGRLKIDGNPPIRFVSDSQNSLLVDAMDGLKKQHMELTTLPGEEFRMYNETLMQQCEVLDRLEVYTELSIKYVQSCIKLETTQLISDHRE